MWNRRVFLTTRNDKCMPRIRDKVCEKRRNFYEACFPYLRAVNDGERSFAGEQLRNGRFTLNGTYFRRDRVARRKGYMDANHIPPVVSAAECSRE